MSPFVRISEIVHEAAFHSEAWRRGGFEELKRFVPVDCGLWVVD